MIKTQGQTGVVLPSALFMLVAVLVVSMAMANTALQSEQAGRNARDRLIAQQAADAALADAERDIEGGTDPGSARAALFAFGSAVGFTLGCGRDSANLGLCLRAEQTDVPVWQSTDLTDARVSVAYGSFTGALMPTGHGSLPARAPRYIIELMPLVLAGADAGTQPDYIYRITAIGFGVRESTSVIVQGCYRKLERSDPQAPPGSAAGLASGRLA